MCFYIRKHLSTKKKDLILFTREISWCQEHTMLCCDNQKYYIYYMNIICFAVIIKNNTNILWNVTHWSLLYICVGINIGVLIKGIIYLQK